MTHWSYFDTVVGDWLPGLASVFDYACDSQSAEVMFYDSTVWPLYVLGSKVKYVLFYNRFAKAQEKVPHTQAFIALLNQDLDLSGDKLVVPIWD